MSQGSSRTLILIVVAGLSTAVGAQTAPKDAAYPSKPIRLVVTFPPGGTPDSQARMMTEDLSKRLGQQIVVENRSGATGTIGMEFVAKAPPDGYTLVITTSATWAVTPHLSKLPYDTVADFAPIIYVATTPGVLIVHPSVPARTVKELVTLAKRRPGELNYGSAGAGGYGHVSAELFAILTMIKMTNVAYKGSGPLLTDLLGGHLHMAFNSALPAVPYIRSGRLRGLATTGLVRLAALPELPTIAESGVPGYESATWTGIAAPARTPQSVIERLNREIAAVLQIPRIQERFLASGSTITGGTPAQFQDYLRSELAKYGRVVKEAGIKPDSGG